MKKPIIKGVLCFGFLLILGGCAGLFRIDKEYSAFGQPPCANTANLRYPITNITNNTKEWASPVVDGKKMFVCGKSYLMAPGSSLAIGNHWVTNVLLQTKGRNSRYKIPSYTQTVQWNSGYGGIYAPPASEWGKVATVEFTDRDFQ